ncbi:MULTISPECIES: hypothetical protein [Aquimarina]|uniref:DUF4468 domain-containing protein n=1 Tax=Aquimarina algiphila TaxID=2047982 RepID=A0A554VJT7_9FLAO|nr:MULTISPECIES: hypothetical protein [Aquimarina]TSE08187.1 hypothetical protein FOF46_13360 [Aquimarina algiphila]
MGKTLLLFLTISSLSFAQLPKSLVTDIQEDYTYSDYTGSVYMNPSYKESSVIHEKSTTYHAKLRYNIQTDAIEYKSQSTLYELVKNQTTHVRIEENYFYYCNFKNQRGLSRPGYYVLVELTDLYSIYKKYSLSITDVENQGISGSAVKPGKIRQVITYYIEEAGVIMELPLNKKEMLATFSDKENELKEYLKKEKIRLKKEEDLIRFVARYNALKSSDSSPSHSLLSNTDRAN